MTKSRHFLTRFRCPNPKTEQAKAKCAALEAAVAQGKEEVQREKASYSSSEEMYKKKVATAETAKERLYTQLSGQETELNELADERDALAQRVQELEEAAASQAGGEKPVDAERDGLLLQARAALASLSEQHRAVSRELADAKQELGVAKEALQKNSQHRASEIALTR